MSLLGVVGETIFSTADARCWRHGNALIVSLEQSRPTITADVLGAIERALNEAERGFATLVVTSSSDNFAFGTRRCRRSRPCVARPFPVAANCSCIAPPWPRMRTAASA